MHVHARATVFLGDGLLDGAHLDRARLRCRCGGRRGRSRLLASVLACRGHHLLQEVLLRTADAPSAVVLAGGHHHDQVQARYNEQALPSVPQGPMPADLLAVNPHAAEPPMVAVLLAWLARREQGLHPRLWNDLPAFPAPSLQHHPSNARHITRAQAQPGVGARAATHIIDPLPITQAKWLEQPLTGIGLQALARPLLQHKPPTPQ